MKGKTLTALVLAVEIASIVTLHAYKINQSEKAAAKEVTKSLPGETETHVKPSISLAVLK
jgi:hypothetical protein